MRQLGTLTAEADARRLVDYLLTQGIAARVDPENNAWSVWIHHEDQLDKARAEFSEFQANPAAERYQQASSAANQLRREESRRDTAARKNYIDLRRRWDVRGTGNTPITWGLIILSVLVAILTQFGHGNIGLLRYLLIAEPLIGPDWTRTWSLIYHLQHGEIWRLFTPIFIHWDMIHLVFNMMWMYDLGRRVEVLLGKWWYLLLVLAVAAVSNLAQLYAEGPDFGGMSGVVYGLIGLAWVQYTYGGVVAYYLGPGGMFMAILWFFLCMSGYVGDIANWAHGAGLVAGLVAGYLPIWWQSLRRR